MFNNSCKSITKIICAAIAFLCTSATHADDANPLATVMRSGTDAQLGIKQASAAKLSWADFVGNKASPGSSSKLMRLLDLPAATLALGVCGDSEPDPGETCDDGNTVSGDGCDATCQVEAGADCTDAIAGVLTENLLLNGSFESGIAPWTNTGTPNAPIASPNSCGGCDLSYEMEGGGWYWAGGAPSASSTSATQLLVIPVNATTLTFNVWEAFCVPDNGAGDFVRVTIDGNEVFNSGTCISEGFYAPAQIVDLATAPGGPYNDGGTHTIAVLGDMDFTVGDSQSGSIFVDNFSIDIPLVPPIPPIPSSCLVGVCGDGVLSDGEACDDGNTTGGDGCSASCAVEEDDFACLNDVADTALDVLNGSLSSNENISDGGLEQGTPSALWAETGTVFTPICSQALCGAALANDGAFFAWFGGSSSPNSQTLTQSNVTISALATDLTFDLLVGVCDSAADVFRVAIDGNTEFEFACTGAAGFYEPQSIDLIAGGYNDGGLHEIVFSADTLAVAAGNSNFFVDNISINYPVSPDRAPGVSACFALQQACGTIEKFESGIPAGWTVFNFGPDPADGWGTSVDGICGSQNWLGGNVTGGSGAAACADSDASGQIDLDGGASEASEMDAYLCSPALDLSQVTDPQFSFLVNYQASDNDLNDNGTEETTDDFDDDFMELVFGIVAPNALTLPTYTPLGQVIDHLDTTLALSEEFAASVDLTDQGAITEGYVCFHYRGTYAWFAQVDNAALRGSACSAPSDADGDGVPDAIDNCPDDANTDQADNDGDGDGDVCDADDDNDGVDDGADNCPLDENSDQADNDGDGDGDVCDADDDNDGVDDGVDNCPLDENSDQADNDGDGDGDVCDADDDNDGVDDGVDNCPLDENSDQADNDGDGDGDVCDADDDNDGVDDGVDNCPLDENSDQADNDGDGDGDVCDADDDNDGVDDGVDNCPLDENSDQADNDNDGLGDVCDPDDDNDGVLDTADVCPSTVIPDLAPSGRLGRNRWTFDGQNGANFTQAPPQAGSRLQFTIEDTGGCSCEQIVKAADAGKGQLRKGCSTGLMKDWLESL